MKRCVKTDKSAWSLFLRRPWGSGIILYIIIQHEQFNTTELHQVMFVTPISLHYKILFPEFPSKFFPLYNCTAEKSFPLSVTIQNYHVNLHWVPLLTPVLYFLYWFYTQTAPLSANDNGLIISHTLDTSTILFVLVLHLNYTSLSQ